jgi:exopolyphosphatase/guanosine-5'-triphosphate,3'-diphosphate pyrophosphatase
MGKKVIIDIGSNSVRLILVRFVNGGYKIVNDLKESLRLIDGMDENNNIRQSYIDATVKTMHMFKALADSVEADEIFAVATEAIRKAANQNEFVKRIFSETGISIRILSGEEEAHYDYIAIRSSLPYDNALIIDIGGGSTEIIQMINGKKTNAASLPFGTINLTKKFDLSDSITPQKETAVKFYLFEELKRLSWLNRSTAPRLIGIGGTIRNIGEIDKVTRNYPLLVTHFYEMNSEAVQSIHQNITNASLTKRKLIPGISKGRADIFPGASYILSLLLEITGIEKIIISGCGLREGFLFSYLLENGTEMLNPLDFSVLNTMKCFDVNQDHARNVYRLSRQIFMQLSSLHKMPEALLVPLKLGALLHDCGVNINYYNHHTHSLYMIVNAGILGVSHRNLLIGACVAGGHRKKGRKINYPRFAPILSPLDVEHIEKMSLILSIAESLDRNMCGCVDQINCFICDDEVYISATPRLGKYIGLEINDALQFRSLFKKTFNKTLKFNILPEQY